MAWSALCQDFSYPPTPSPLQPMAKPHIRAGFSVTAMNTKQLMSRASPGAQREAAHSRGHSPALENVYLFFTRKRLFP